MANMTLISTQTVGAGGQSTISFTGIPQTFTDLQLVLSLRTTESATLGGGTLTFNGSTTGYYERLAYGSGTAAASANHSNVAGISWSTLNTGSLATANTFSSDTIYIPNYAGNSNKSFLSENVNEQNASAGDTYLNACLWGNTAAITSITITATGASNYVQYSTASLYGISNAANISVKATGGTITVAPDGYVYHTFTASGTFTPTTSVTADVMVIAGGGGGGQFNGGGGGGGAGGFRVLTSQTLSGAQTVTIGAGGAMNSNGADSSIGAITATGGGNGMGGSGGSGGGGYSGTSSANGGTGVAGQGNAGGNGITGTNQGGGGGGASSAGVAGASGGNGGSAISTYSSWATATGTGVSGAYAGGGGGGGAGGGAAGGGGGASAGVGTNGVSAAATANTGSGSGGTLFSGSGSAGNGGSGLVIVRYAA